MGARRDAARLSRAAHGERPPGTTAPDRETDTDRDHAIDRTARLAAIARVRPGDDRATEQLRRALRDQQYMVHVAAAVDRWPALTDDQRDTVAALLNTHHETS